MKVEATLAPEPDIKACFVRINFNSHNNPGVMGDNAEQVQLIEQQLLKMGKECYQGSGQFNLSVKSLTSALSPGQIQQEDKVKGTVRSTFKVFYSNGSLQL